MGTTEVAEDAPPPPPALAELSLAEASKARRCGPHASVAVLQRALAMTL